MTFLSQHDASLGPSRFRHRLHSLVTELQTETDPTMLMMKLLFIAGVLSCMSYNSHWALAQGPSQVPSFKPSKSSMPSNGPGIDANVEFPSQYVSKPSPILESLYCPLADSNVDAVCSSQPSAQ